MTLRSRVVPRPSLDAEQRERMFVLMDECYEGVERQRFFHDLDNKQFVIVLDDPKETGARALKGFSTLLVLARELDGEVVDVVFSGDTVIDPAHWGSKALQTAFGRFCLEKKLAHPRRRLFWLLLSKGFRTYLLAVNYFPRTFPKPGAQPPTSLVRFRDALATELWGSAYSPLTQVLHYDVPRDRVRAPLAPPPPESLRDPAVRFFTETNPRAHEGDELVCLVPLPLQDIGRALVRATAKAISSAVRPRRRRRAPPVAV